MMTKLSFHFDRGRLISVLVHSLMRPGIAPDVSNLSRAIILREVVVQSEGLVGEGFRGSDAPL